MKKLFSTMIALAMLAATPLTVFATGSSSNTGGNTEIDVNGKYIEGNAATMISVDITWVLSSIFRKFDSEKMKLCAGKPGEGAAKPRLIAAEHMTAAVSGAAKPFILTLDSVGGVCYLIAVFMLLLSRFQSNISCIDTALFSTLFPKHIVVWRRPASEQTFRQGMYQRLSFCVVSHDSHVR